MGLYVGSPLRLQKLTHTIELKNHVKYEKLNQQFLISQT